MKEGRSDQAISVREVHGRLLVESRERRGAERSGEVKRREEKRSVCSIRAR